MISAPSPYAFSLLTMTALGVVLLAGCSAPVMCGPCPGNGIQLTAEGATLTAGRTYELCDGRGPCQKGAWVVPTDTGTRAAAVPVFVVSLPGTAEDYSRVTVKAIVRDQAGREIGEGQATFPEYQPVQQRGSCQCHDAFVELRLKETIRRS
ncbi:hypothetical protein [Nonomuraea sp. NPDC050786]|uniref:hypothetical protein n=1 Tax=Nonomuraea sp. NPDC050786 TaxID=3154840 RepID=UPI0033D14D7E